jgi:hypothetical protein
MRILPRLAQQKVMFAVVSASGDMGAAFTG